MRLAYDAEMYAIMGISGQVGSATAAALLESGKPVRGIVRDPEKAKAWRERGVELTPANFDDAAALAAAFSGASGLFAMLPPYFAPSPDLREARDVIAAVRAAVEQARPERVVYLSSIGAEQTSGLGLITTLHLFEEALDALPIPTAALRAAWFMENCAWDLEPARQGKFYSYLEPLNHPFPLVSTLDIGRVEI